MGLTAWGLEPVRPGRLRLGAALALYRRRMRRRRWIQDLLAVLGIAAGVALLYATQIAATSLSGPVTQLNKGIVGAGQLQVLARGGTTIDEATYDRIVALPGVRRAAPLLQVPGNLVGMRGQRPATLFGADPRIVRLRGDLLRGFSSADAARQEAIVVPEPAAEDIGLRFGDDVRLQVAGRNVAIPATVAGRKQVRGLVDTSVVLMPLRYLQRLAGFEHRLTRVLVEAEPGKVQQVERRLRALRVPGADVRSSTYETKLFKNAAMPTSAASLIFAGLSALIGWMFAICALLVTASERRRLAAQQRRQGFPPAATLKTLLVDVVVIGAAGVAIGFVAGELISRHGFRSDVTFLSGAFPIGDVRVVTWQTIVITAAGGMAAAAVGVLVPVRDIVRESFRGAAPKRPERAGTASGFGPSQLCGLLALIVALVITFEAPALAVIGLIVLGAAVVCLLPTVVRQAIVIVGRANRVARASAAVELALHQLRTRRWEARGLAIATIGAVAVFGATSLQGARLNLQAGLEDLSRGLNAPAAIWVTAPGAGDSIGTATFDPDTAARIARVPGVGAVERYRASLLDVADRRAWIIAPPAAENGTPAVSQILEGAPSAVRSHLRTPGWATVSRTLAGRLGVGVGDAFVLPSPRPLRVRVAAITTNLGWSSGAIVVNAQDFLRGWPGGAIAAYHLQTVPGTEPDVVRRRISRELGPRPSLVAETASTRANRQNKVAEAGLSRLREITVLTIIAAVVSMVAAMTGLLWLHRPMIAEHKFHGLTTGVLWRSLLAETAVLFGVGVATGAAFGLLGQILCTRGVERVTGFPVIDQLQPATTLATSCLVLAASLVAVLLPGFVVARTTPAHRE